VASALGLPDAGIANYTDMVERARMIASITRTPLIADADTGYGGLLNVQHTVRGYEAAGVCAIQLEDQEFPKKCGHMLGRRVVASLKEKRSSVEPGAPLYEFQAMSRLMGFDEVGAFDRRYRDG
jgi:2-methylisocitrate lyase-like PEP mutase family enzyme